MFDAPLELSDVLQRLKRADQALREFVAPLWPGVRGVVAWVDGRAQRLALEAVPAEPLYGVCTLTAAGARVDRPAAPEEAARYRAAWPAVSVVLLDEGLAAPAGMAERLLGFTAPRPIWFAPAEPLAAARARFDGVNLLYDGPQAAATTGGRPLPSLFATDELFGAPKRAGSEAEAREALTALRQEPTFATACRLRAVLEAAGAVCETWAATPDGLALCWRRDGRTVHATLASAVSPLTSGICLAHPTPPDATRLTRLLVDHLLDAWQPDLGGTLA